MGYIRVPKNPDTSLGLMVETSHPQNRIIMDYRVNQFLRTDLDPKGVD